MQSDTNTVHQNAITLLEEDHKAVMLYLNNIK